MGLQFKRDKDECKTWPDHHECEDENCKCYCHSDAFQKDLEIERPRRKSAKKELS